MTLLRQWIAGRPGAVAALILAALGVRLIVPAGMMPAFGPGGARLIICPGRTAPAAAMPGMTMPKAGHPTHDAPAEQPCAFTGLLAAALDDAALPVLPPAPVAAVAVLLTVLVSVRLHAVRLWPHRRGPPATAFA